MRADAEVIFNPAGGRGSAKGLLPELLSRFGEIGISIRETGRPGDEELLAGDALARGVTTIVAVGGDGTCSNIANAILQAGSACRLAVVPAGTGNDFAKTLGVRHHSVAELATLVSRNAATSIDVGLAEERYFLNSCGFGFDASVLEATKQARFLKGDALYIYSALAQLFNYRGFPVSVGLGTGELQDNTLMVTVSNGRFLGGAFVIAPAASVIDGQLDVCVVSDANVIQRINLFASALRGRHTSLPSVRAFTSAAVTLSFPEPPSMELDGELRRARSNRMTLECVPHALNVIAADRAKL